MDTTKKENNSHLYKTPESFNNVKRTKTYNSNNKDHHQIPLVDQNFLQQVHYTGQKETIRQDTQELKNASLSVTKKPSLRKFNVA